MADEVLLRCSEKLGQMTGAEKPELGIKTTLSFTESMAVALNTKDDLAVHV
eukprot:IDg780t1